MKYKYLAFLFALIAGLSTTTCNKDEIVHQELLIENQTLSLAAVADASIYIQYDPYEPLYGDNGAGASDLLKIGYSDDRLNFARALVRFDISSLPAGAKLVSATLSFTGGQSGNDPHPITVHKLTQSWTEGDTDDGCEFASHEYCTYPGNVPDTDVTWYATSNGGTPWTTEGGTFVAAVSASSINGAGIPIYTSDGLVTDIESWLATPANNFGWLLKIDEENIRENGGEMTRYLSREASTSKSREFAPPEGADPLTKPTLTIVYHF